MLTRSLERAVEPCTCRPWSFGPRTKGTGQVQCDEGAALRGMSSQTTRERHLLTLMVMPTLGLFKPYALNDYSGTALRLLTGRHRPYSADEMEHFILSCTRVGWTEPLTADVE